MATDYTTILSGNSVVSPWGGKKVYQVQETFDLTKLAAVLINADSVQLFDLPAKTLVLGATLEVVGAGTSATTGTQTLKLRAGTTDLTGTLDGKATGITMNTAHYVGAAAAKINVLAAVATDVVTANPKIKVTLVLADAS